MQQQINRLWSRVAIVALLVGVDAAISLPIMGATYRPFSWMSIAPADEVTLYPVIQDLSVVREKPTVQVAVAAGANVILQRNTNLLDANGWQDVASATAPDRIILLIDTNPVSRAVFYRVKQILDGAP